jgi:predicted nucleic acid-binding protein
VSLASAGSFAYFDSSALVKLVVREQETAALVPAASAWPQRVSSALAQVEVVRAARRVGGGPASDRAAEVMTSFTLIAVDAPVLAAASAIRPETLSTPDAIHLVTALSLAGAVDAFVVYDTALAAAASSAGLSVVSPV